MRYCKARRGVVWPGMVRSGLVSLARNFYLAMSGLVGRGMVGRGLAWQGMVWSGFSGEKFLCGEVGRG